MSKFQKQLSEILPFVEGEREKSVNGVESYKVHFEGLLTKEAIHKLLSLGLETLKRSGAGVTMYFKPSKELL